jgi:hypothetical protein
VSQAEAKRSGGLSRRHLARVSPSFLSTYKNSSRVGIYDDKLDVVLQHEHCQCKRDIWKTTPLSLLLLLKVDGKEKQVVLRKFVPFVSEKYLHTVQDVRCRVLFVPQCGEENREVQKSRFAEYFHGQVCGTDVVLTSWNFELSEKSALRMDVSARLLVVVERLQVFNEGDRLHFLFYELWIEPQIEAGSDFGQIGPAVSAAVTSAARSFAPAQK